MTKPIPDKAEVVVEFLDKLFIGTFERTDHFDADFGEAGIAVSLRQDGSETRKSASMNFHYFLFAGILDELAKSVDAIPPMHQAPRKALRNAVEQLYLSLSRSSVDDPSTLTPDDEVRLLHLLE